MAAAKERCKLCGNEPGKYVCPRCNVLYCSLDCYRGEAHSDCSELFYRKCVEEELMESAPDQQSSHAMLDILQRVQQQNEEEVLCEDAESDEVEVDSDDSGGEVEEDLAARLADVNLDDADVVWDKLSRQEKEEFQKIIASGDPSGILPVWEPWWNVKQKQPLIVEVASDEDEDEDTIDASFMKRCPLIRDSIPPLKDPSRVNPAVVYGVQNVVFAYALVATHFAGDHLERDMCTEAAQALLQLSSSIGQGNNFLDLDSALAAVALEASQGLGLTQNSIQQGQEDTEKIYEGPGKDYPLFYLQAALSDCLCLLEKALVAQRPGKARGEFSSKFVSQSSNRSTTGLSKKQINMAMKKLEFYLAWTKVPGSVQN